MEAGHYIKGDRVPSTSEVSPFVVRYETELIKVHMLNEQKEFNEAHIISSIPEPNMEILDELIPPEVKAMQAKMQEPSYDVDELLDKISDEGLESLSDEEKEFLKNQSDKG
jgi:hypothetical protein